MTDVFISYSRKDKAFVQTLHQALKESKYNAWVDWQDIPLTADWWAEIEAGIEAADTFIFVISPDSIESKVCAQEIDHAVANNKRLVPIVRREGFDIAWVHSALGKHNWLFFKEDNDFDIAFQALIAALNTDLGYVKDHTRLLVKALEWEKKHRRDDLLLRGDDLQEAELWLDNALQINHEPLPAEQHKHYISQSRDVEDANRRVVEAGNKAKRLVRIGAGVLAGTIAVATVIGMVTQRSAQRTRKLAQIEQDSINALQQFEYQELNALVQAMKATEDLKAVTGGGDQPLRAYVPQSAPRVLQQILDQITLRNQFTNMPEAISEGATSVTFSPDGEAMVITDRDGNVTLKTPQGIDLRTLGGHSQRVYQADFSPDGQMIGTASDVFRLFDRKGSLIKTLEHPSGNSGRIRFSPDGQYIALSGWQRDSIVLLDTAGNLVTTIDAQTVTNIDFHPSEPLLANASNNGAVEIWDFQGNKISTLEGHDGSVKGVRFSPTGDYLVSGSDDASVLLWNLETQTSKLIDDLDGWVFNLDFHPDGEPFAAGSTGGLVRLYDLEGNILQNFSGHVGSIRLVSFSPDGETLVTAASDGQVRMWSLNSKTVADLDSHTDALWNADVSPDGTQIATASADGTVRIWDMSGQEIQQLELPDQSVNNVVYSPDGDVMVTSTEEGDIYLWDTEGNLVERFAIHSSRTLGLDLSPNGQYGLSGSHDTTATLWSMDGNVQAVVNHDDWIRDAAFSPDGQAFATTSEDALARLWDLDGNLLAEFVGHADGVNAISFSPDGTKLVTASDDSTVKLWDLQGNLIHSFQKHQGRVWTVAFSPDGDSIATGTSDGYARIWDLKENLLSEFKGHEETVNSVDFSPDGYHLVTTSRDGTAKLWRIARTLNDLLTQGCDWLADYLLLHPDELLELESCQRQDLLPQAAPYLVQNAMQTARAGDIQMAQQQLATALSWNPEVDLDPETSETEQNAAQVARKFSAAYQLTEGQRLANTLKLEEAIQAYEQALELNPTIDLDPDTDAVEQDTEAVARRYAALELQKQGQLQAQQLKLETATQTLAEALALNPNLDLNPDTEEMEQDAEAMALKFSAPGYLIAGQQYVKNGDVEAAVQAYQTALDSDPDLEVLQSTWDRLCWLGSVQGHAAKVRFACENEVTFSGPSTFDSRGIVQVLDGDVEGAIASLQAYIDVPGRSQDRVIQGQAWIDALKTGENPMAQYGF